MIGSILGLASLLVLFQEPGSTAPTGHQTWDVADRSVRFTSTSRLSAVSLPGSLTGVFIITLDCRIDDRGRLVDCDTAEQDPPNPDLRRYAVRGIRNIRVDFHEEGPSPDDRLLIPVRLHGYLVVR
ncbi:hypothetical protein [Brevundimonas sp.]|uniref:hypothetical protein n=1 Tax=Brevundimonas sp. TaxID=1871086 RepID=UPI0025C24254|nr:hypothetical protein [Brevundimonas sp.]